MIKAWHTHILFQWFWSWSFNIRKSKTYTIIIPNTHMFPHCIRYLLLKSNHGDITSMNQRKTYSSCHSHSKFAKYRIDTDQWIETSHCRWRIDLQSWFDWSFSNLFNSPSSKFVDKITINCAILFQFSAVVKIYCDLFNKNAGCKSPEAWISRDQIFCVSKMQTLYE